MAGVSEGALGLLRVRVTGRVVADPSELVTTTE
jgi:hypothetical protein